MRFKNGDKVVMCNAEKSLKLPEFYPPAGTQGVIKNVNDGEIIAMVSWPRSSGVDYNELYGDWCWSVALDHLVSKEEYEAKEDKDSIIKNLVEKVVDLQQKNNELRKDKEALESRVDKMSVDILYFKELAKKIVDA